MLRVSYKGFCMIHVIHVHFRQLLHTYLIKIFQIFYSVLKMKLCFDSFRGNNFVMYNFYGQSFVYFPPTGNCSLDDGTFRSTVIANVEML